jgi:hypothetical protein
MTQLSVQERLLLNRGRTAAPPPHYTPHAAPPHIIRPTLQVAPPPHHAPHAHAISSPLIIRPMLQVAPPPITPRAHTAIMLSSPHHTPHATRSPSPLSRCKQPSPSSSPSSSHYKQPIPLMIHHMLQAALTTSTPSIPSSLQAAPPSHHAASSPFPPYAPCCKQPSSSHCKQPLPSSYTTCYKQPPHHTPSC